MAELTCVLGCKDLYNNPVSRKSGLIRGFVTGRDENIKLDETECSYFRKSISWTERVNLLFSCRGDYRIALLLTNGCQSAYRQPICIIYRTNWVPVSALFSTTRFSNLRKNVEFTWETETFGQIQKYESVTKRK